PCEHYFTATKEAAGYLYRLGVPSGTASVTGIPVHPRFALPKGQSACRRRHGLPEDRPLLLLLAGGHGVGPPVGAALRAVLEAPRTTRRRGTSWKPSHRPGGTGSRCSATPALWTSSWRRRTSPSPSRAA